MLKSISRAKQCRQIYLHEVFFAVDGTAGTPAASGLDSKFVSSVVDNGAGDYTINFQDKAQRDMIVSSIMPTTASRVYEVKAVTSSSVRVQFRNLSGVAADADFNIGCLWHGSKHKY